MRTRGKFKFGFFMLTMFLTISLLCSVSSFAAQSPQIPLAGSAIPQFMQELPTLTTNTQSIPKINTVFGNTALTIRMCEFNAQVLPPPMPATRVWGYIPGPGPCPAAGTTLDTYIGPVIVSNRGSSTDITWVNDLGNTATSGLTFWKYSTDQTLHWADPLGLDPVTGLPTSIPEANGCMMMGGIPAFGSPCAQNYSGPIPGVVHLHGGEVPPELDGGPDAWFTSDGASQGHGYYSFPGAPANAATYRYPNTQEAGPLWFHDHVLGITRLNVYAGLAGAYFIQDPLLSLPANLHPLTEVVPLVIQDRMFDINGQLFFQTDSAGGILWTTNPEHPYWSPEFVGDAIVVNGKAWPYLNVQQKRYRFLFLNGSNARTYEMFLVDPVTKIMGPPMWVIGTDGGYLDNPVKIDPNAVANNHLIIQPGERYEVIIDFNDPAWLALFTKKTGPFSGRLVLNNIGRTPFPKGAPPMGSTLGNIMQFRVALGGVADTSYNPASGTPLRTGNQVIKRLVNPATGTLAVTAQKTRQLTLNEVMGMPWTGIDPVTGLLTAYPGGPLEVLVNNTKWSGTDRPDFTPISVNGITTYYSELPLEGETEVWEIVNLTADAHPIHLHLVQFQLINRQMYNVSMYTAAYDAAYGQNPLVPLPAGCTPGIFCPAYGPPLDYDPALNPLSGGKYGGNPDIGALKAGKKGMTPVYLQNGVMPPAPSEAGWKDTVIVYPGQVTRLAVRWAPTDLPTNAAASMLYFPFDPSDFNGHGYVWHCHIIDHEDNEMMRPDVVDLNPAAPGPALRPLQIGRDY